jgi:hypothetical protein
MTTDCPMGQTCQNGTCVVVRGQGLLEPCSNNDNCANGLQCLGTPPVCTCPQPGPVPADQIVLSTDPNQPSSFIVTWPVVPNADFYEVTLFSTDPAANSDIRLLPTKVVRAPPANIKTVTTTFTNIGNGIEYFVEIVTGSNTCGISGLAALSRSTPVVHRYFVFPSTNVTVTLGARNGNFQSVTLTWQATIPPATLYTIIFEDERGPGSIFKENVRVPSITLLLEVGHNYFVTILPSILPLCDASLADSLQFQFRLA